MGKPTRCAVVAITCAFVTTLLLSSCATNATLGSPDPGLRGQWELFSAQDAAGPLNLANESISLTIGHDPSSEGRSSCSDYTAQILGTLSALWVRASFPQYPKCGNQAQQDLEQRYESDLEAVRSATATRNTLTLVAPGVSLRFRKTVAKSTADLVNRSWMLTGVSSIPYGTTRSTTFISIDEGHTREQPPSLRFSSDGGFSGSTGCRLFAGRYVQDAGEVIVDQLGAIGNSGCDAAGTAVDDYMLNVISSGFTFESRGGVLVLASDQAQIELKFRQPK